MFDDVLERYLTYGGMPTIASLATTKQAHSAYFLSLYDAVVTRDILNRDRIQGQSKVTDAALLERIASFLSLGASLLVSSTAARTSASRRC